MKRLQFGGRLRPSRRTTVTYLHPKNGDQLLGPSLDGPRNDRDQPEGAFSYNSIDCRHLGSTSGRFVISTSRWYSSSPRSKGLAKGLVSSPLGPPEGRCFRRGQLKEGARVSAVRSSASKNQVVLRVLKRCLRLNGLRDFLCSGDRLGESKPRTILSPGRAGRSSGGANSSVRSGFRARVRPLQPESAGVALLHLAGLCAETRAPHPFFTARDLHGRVRAARSDVHRPSAPQPTAPGGALPSKRASGMRCAPSVRPSAFVSGRASRVQPPAPA